MDANCCQAELGLTCQAKLLQQVLQGITEVVAHSIALQSQSLQTASIVMHPTSLAATRLAFVSARATAVEQTLGP